ncbi:MAG: oxidoreductase [Chloroflexi bacterium]|nr:oxidoreductase [Chloroflexota bacterium]
MLPLANVVNIAYFMEAKRDFEPGPYDISIAEGSITTEREIAVIKKIREESKILLGLGVCASEGGIQGLRYYDDINEMKARQYPKPELINTLPVSMPYSEHVKVDFYLQGCPIDRDQLLGILGELLLGKHPRVPSNSVCLECKRRGNVCVLVAQGIPCMGPVTHDGCGALCPSYGRGCYSCFGPMDDPKPERFADELAYRGMSDEDIWRQFHKITSYARPYREIRDRHGPTRD